MTTHERWLTTIADKAIRTALADEDVLDAVIAYKIDATPFTKHRLTGALASNGITGTRERARAIDFIEKTPKFDDLVRERLAEVDLSAGHTLPGGS